MTVDDAWLAGIIEGEGYISCYPAGATKVPQIRIRVKMTDEDVVARVAALCGVRHRKEAPPPRPHHKQQYVATITCGKAEALLRRILPLLGERRTEQVEAAFAKRAAANDRRPAE
jgi:hypothetical protein